MTEVGGCQQRIRLVVASVYCRAVSVTDDYGEALLWATRWAPPVFQEERVTPGTCGYDEALG
jgi:hypothetical protein